MKYRVRVSGTFKNDSDVTSISAEANKVSDSAVKMPDGGQVMEASGKELNIDLAFDNLKDAQKVMDAAKAQEANLVDGQCFIEECGHDESPPRPCIKLDSIGLSAMSV